jgi:hypothetical protein
MWVPRAALALLVIAARVVHTAHHRRVRQQFGGTHHGRCSQSPSPKKQTQIISRLVHLSHSHTMQKNANNAKQKEFARDYVLEHIEWVPKHRGRRIRGNKFERDFSYAVDPHRHRPDFTDFYLLVLVNEPLKVVNINEFVTQKLYDKETQRLPFPLSLYEKLALDRMSRAGINILNSTASIGAVDLGLAALEAKNLVNTDNNIVQTYVQKIHDLAPSMEALRIEIAKCYNACRDYGKNRLKLTSVEIEILIKRLKNIVKCVKDDFERLFHETSTNAVPTVQGHRDFYTEQTMTFVLQGDVYKHVHSSATIVIIKGNNPNADDEYFAKIENVNGFADGMLPWPSEWNYSWRYPTSINLICKNSEFFAIKPHYKNAEGGGNRRLLGKAKGARAKLRVGPKGGKYYVRNGRKVYVRG